MNKVLVTGANGFVGTALTLRLLRDGIPVRAMCRTPRSGEALKQAGAEIVNGDLHLIDSLRAGAKAATWCSMLVRRSAAREPFSTTPQS